MGRKGFSGPGSGFGDISGSVGWVYFFVNGTICSSYLINLWCPEYSNFSVRVSILGTLRKRPFFDENSILQRL